MKAHQITKAQIRAIHASLSYRGIDDDTYRALLQVQFGVTTCKDLSLTEANALLRRLNGGKYPQRRRQRIQQPASPRKTSGKVVHLASPAQQRLISAMVAEIDWETEDGYRRWLDRSLGLARVCTTAEAGRVINGLKGLKRHGHRKMGS